MNLKLDIKLSNLEKELAKFQNIDPRKVSIEDISNRFDIIAETIIDLDVSEDQKLQLVNTLGNSANIKNLTDNSSLSDSEKFVLISGVSRLLYQKIHDLRKELNPNI